MKSTIAKTFIFMTLLLGLLGTSCRPTQPSSTICDRGYPVKSAASGSYQYGRKPERFSYTSEAEMELTRLHLVFENQEGSVSWEFTDPEGEVQWQGSHFQQGKFDETRDFNPVRGEWTLVIDVQDGKGSYDHCWMAK